MWILDKIFKKQNNITSKSDLIIKKYSNNKNILQHNNEIIFTIKGDIVKDIKLLDRVIKLDITKNKIEEIDYDIYQEDNKVNMSIWLSNDYNILTNENRYIVDYIKLSTMLINIISKGKYSKEVNYLYYRNYLLLKPFINYLNNNIDTIYNLK
ncbi:hypothetical protein ACVWU4_000989 [Campylobacter coli]